jgi:hypothetical protein
LRAVVRFAAVRRFAGFLAVVFFATALRAVRLFAGGTVTYLSLWVAGVEVVPISGGRPTSRRT